MEKKKEVLIRLYLLLGVFAIIALVLLWRTVDISIVEGDKWRKKIDQTNLKYKDIPADRGDILADDDKLLATSLPSFEIRMDTRAEGLTQTIFDKGIDSLAWYLSRYVNEQRSAYEYKLLLKKARKANNRYLLIKRKANFAEMKRMKKWPIFRNGANKGGFIAIRKTQRVKPFNMLASRTIGVYAKDRSPKGLEGSYNSYLSGKDGRSLMKRIKGGIWLPVSEESKIDPVRGHDIKTTINVNMQDIAQQALLKGLRKSGGDKGVAIIMEVKTGAIKAIANLRKTRTGGWAEVYNDAVLTATEPGSTFKLASVLALMEDKLAGPDTRINLYNGKRKFYNQWMRDASYHNLTSSTIAEAFTISSNVGIAGLIWKYYKENQRGYVQRIKSFGLSSPTGIDLKGETKPLIKEAWNRKQGWSGVTLPWMAIGYEVKLTPIQMLTFYNAVANNGKMMKPYLVQEVLKEGRVIKSYSPKVLKDQIARYENIKAAQKMLRDVVIKGTAKRPLSTAKCPVAAKTGTTQSGYGLDKSKLKYQSSMIGYFPADQPVYSVYVGIMNIPRDSTYYGSKIAGPVFREMVDKVYSSEKAFIRRLQPEKKPVVYATNGMDVAYAKDIEHILKYVGVTIPEKPKTEWIQLSAHSNILRAKAHSIAKGKVPSVIGMGARDAAYLLEKAGLKVRIQGIGKVQSQSIRPGSIIKGQEIILQLK